MTVIVIDFCIFWVTFNQNCSYDICNRDLSSRSYQTTANYLSPADSFNSKNAFKAPDFKFFNIFTSAVLYKLSNLTLFCLIVTMKNQALSISQNNITPELWCTQNFSVNWYFCWCCMDFFEQIFHLELWMNYVTQTLVFACWFTHYLIWEIMLNRNGFHFLNKEGPFFL